MGTTTSNTMVMLHNVYIIQGSNFWDMLLYLNTIAYTSEMYSNMHREMHSDMHSEMLSKPLYTS